MLAGEAQVGLAGQDHAARRLGGQRDRPLGRAPAFEHNLEIAPGAVGEHDLVAGGEGARRGAIGVLVADEDALGGGRRGQRQDHRKGQHGSAPHPPPLIF